MALDFYDTINDVQPSYGNVELESLLELEHKEEIEI